MSQTLGVAEAIARGREAFGRQAWGDAYAALEAAGRQGPLDPEDLERLAVAAYLIGRDAESERAWERAHLECLRLDDPAQAARCAFWLGLGLLLQGEMARAGGWLSRARRLVDDGDLDCVARGYLLVPTALEALEEGDAGAALGLCHDAAEIAGRFGDKNLLALAWLGRGQALIALGETAAGVALLDEVMVAVTTGEVSPVPAGIVYCAVIEACTDAFDLRRAAEWTEALSGWCDAQPDLVPYRGQCLVHRSQILQAHGEWSAAASEVERARERLAEPPHPALGLAMYQRAELHRLRGEHTEAETAYRQASQLGYEVAPGLALLRLGAGQVEAATATIRRMLDARHDHVGRPAILAASVEIMLAADDVGAAGVAADELSKLAADIDAPLLHAMAAYATGSVLLANGDAVAALGVLRRACTGWRELGMPYEMARARVLMAVAWKALSDDDTAAVELDAARAAFERLGARPDLTVIAALGRVPDPATNMAADDTLTRRECEVLRLVSAGKTNREISAELVISEHTVARHVQNIFNKLGLSSRAAATAYAYEHGLV